MASVTAPASSLATILGPAGPTGDTTGERILDAAYEHVLDFGIRNLSVEAVARRVGIARVTVYRRFAGKDDLLRAVLFREGRRVFAQVDAVVAGMASPEQQLVEGFTATLAAVRLHPLVQRTLQREPEMLATVLVRQGGAMVALARAYLAGHIRAGQRAGRLAGFDPDAAAELAVRLSVSFLLTPQSCIPLETDDDARAFARTYLVPALASLSPPPATEDARRSRR
ncbi:MAG TPA: TetR/AcrR family transcriptional regulator [Acidimicrobiales bacterium]|nr:TetR/AcrR family transcriptional regulator [Acidimicrobiales bacterium]